MKKLILLLLPRLGINPPDLMYKVQAVRKVLWSFLDRRTDSSKLMINIGGTRFYKRHWKVMDYRHPKSRHYDFPGLDYNFDLTSGKPFPIADGSVTYFYSSHTLEHIVPECAQHILNEIHRCLKPGGAVRLTMPDFDVLWEALRRRDWTTIVNIGGDTEHDRFRAAVTLYGLAEARARLRGWPEKARRVEPPYADQHVADCFVGDFSGHRKRTVTLDQLVAEAERLPKELFADRYCAGATAAWKAAHPQEHSNWWNFDKLAGMLRQAGFTTVYRSAPHQSRFPDMVGVGKYWSFDHIRTDTGLYVEAVKGEPAP